MSKNVVVLLAAGVGSRVDQYLPKQYFKLAGKMVFEHTIKIFEDHASVDEIAIVINDKYYNYIERSIISNDFKKVKKILIGGEERYHSSLAAIKAYDDENINIMFHDAVRPFLSGRIIDECFSKLEFYNAIDVAIPTSDTIIQVDDNRIINNMPDRSLMRRGQTPQAFKHGTIKKAYEIATQDEDFKTTDDCGVVHKYLPDEKIYVVEGEYENMKLTYKEDLYLLDKLFQLKSIKFSKSKVDSSLLSNLQDKIGIIYGGNTGIGLSLSKLCESFGAKVYQLSKNKDDVDVTNINDIKRTLKNVYEKEGKIDFIVNTTGAVYNEPLAYMDYKDIDHAVEVNFKSNIIITKESFSYLKETTGDLLLFTSATYTRGRALFSVYSASKAAVVNLTQSITDEWNEFGICVNCINPERTKTPLREGMFGREPEETLLKPMEVANVSAAVLCSRLNGQVIDVRLSDD